MANKRMLSKEIVQSDAFMDMPQSAQCLYFHLNMEADDDGFIGNSKKVMRMVGSNEDDYKILIGKRFVLVFPDGIAVIKHWWMHNYIANDRYHETKYLEHKGKLSIKTNKAYTDRTDGEGIKQLEPKKEETVIPEWMDQESWLNWENYRKSKGKKLTPQTIKLQIKLLEEHKEDHIKIIENSIRNGWTGLFELKKDSRASKTTRDL